MLLVFKFIKSLKCFRKNRSFYKFPCIFKEFETKNKTFRQSPRKYKERFSRFAQSFFITSKTEVDYYHQKMDVQVASRVAERLKTYDLKKLGIFKKISEMLGFDGKYSAGLPKDKF